MNVLHMFRAVFPRKNQVDISALKLAALPGLKQLIGPTLEFQAGILNSSTESLRRRAVDPDDEFDPGPGLPRAGEILTDGVALYVLALTPARSSFRAHTPRRGR